MPRRLPRALSAKAIAGLALTLLLSAPPATAQVEEFSAVVVMSGSDEMEVLYWVAPDRLRMDMPEMSLIWIGGTAPRLLMVQHAERRYMEFTTEQLQAMSQMMARFGRGGPPPAADEPAGDLSFELTGTREQIGRWSAAEVLVRGDRDQEARLWLSEDTDVGLFEVFATVIELTQDLRLPAGMAGGTDPQQMLRQYTRYLRSSGMPDGRVVRLVTSEGGQAGTVTLGEVTPGPAPAGTFEATAGYDKMDMAIPSFPQN